jgi:EmrB/QacA subfamily drug resistance transporter
VEPIETGNPLVGTTPAFPPQRVIGPGNLVAAVRHLGVTAGRIGARASQRDGANAAAHPGAALALILAVAFMVVLDFSIVNVALAAIERELHAGATSVQWVITAYAITFGGLLVLGGRIGDLFGRRRMLVIGLVVFSVSSLAGGLAHSIGVLIAARAVQGVGAAIVAPAALSLITTSVPEGHQRTRALGFYGATASIGFVAGLVLGGILVQFFDWRAVLWVNVPIGLCAAALAPSLIPAPQRAGRRARLDVSGALLVTAAIAAIVYTVSEGPVVGWLSGKTVLFGVIAFVLLAGFVAVEQRHPSPLVRLDILRIRQLAAANAFTMMLGAWSAGELLVMPLYLQLVLHYSPLVTGFAMAPQGVIGFLGASRGARIVRRVGTRRYLMLSGAASAAGLGVLAGFVALRSYPLLLVGFMLAGYGNASGAFGATVAATQGITDSEQGLAGGLVNMSRQVGAASGVAVTAAIIGTGVVSGESVGLDRASVFAVAASALAAVLLAQRGLSTKAPSPSRFRRYRPGEPLLVADEFSDADAAVWPSTDEERFDVEIARISMPVPPR